MSPTIRRARLLHRLRSMGAALNGITWSFPPSVPYDHEKAPAPRQRSRA
jgi:hypothetical protein